MPRQIRPQCGRKPASSLGRLGKALRGGPAFQEWACLPALLDSEWLGAAGCLGDMATAQMQVTDFRGLQQGLVVRYVSVVGNMFIALSGGCFAAAFRLLEFKKLGGKFIRQDLKSKDLTQVCMQPALLDRWCLESFEYDKPQCPSCLGFGGQTTSLGLNFLTSVVG